MSGSASAELESAILGHTLGYAPMPAVSQVFVALCVASEPPTNELEGIEVSGGGYTRMAAVFGDTTEPNIASNTQAVEFPAAQTGWSQIGFFEIWTASSGGSRLYWGPIGAPHFVLAGDIMRFSPGALVVGIGSGAGGSDSIMAGVIKTDRSGTIALAGTAQTLMAANSGRQGWSFQNKSTANMWFNDLGNAADPAANSATYLPPGAYYESEPGGASITALSIIGDVTAAQFVAKEW